MVTEMRMERHKQNRESEIGCLGPGNLLSKKTQVHQLLKIQGLPKGRSRGTDTDLWLIYLQVLFKILRLPTKRGYNKNENISRRLRHLKPFHVQDNMLSAFQISTQFLLNPLKEAP